MSKTEAVCSKILVPLALLLVLRLSASIYHSLVFSLSTTETRPEFKFNYASLESGAKVLAASSHINGAKGLLQENSEKYMVVPCLYSEEWVDFSLSEDIRIEEVEIRSGEMYSSPFIGVTFEGASTYPAEKWTKLGRFPLKEGVRKQSFRVKQRLWIRYVRVTFSTSGSASHYYCTMSRIAIYGSTLLQGLHEELDSTKEETEEKISRIKATKVVSGPLSTLSDRTTNVADSLRMIASMQRLRYFGLNPLIPGPVLYRNETVFPDFSTFNVMKKDRNLEIKEAGSVFKVVAEHVVSTAVKMEVMGEYMNLLEQLSLKTQSEIHSMGLNVISRIDKLARRTDGKPRISTKH